MKKKLVSLLLAATMVAGLVGCGGSDTATTTDSSSDTAAESGAASEGDSAAEPYQLDSLTMVVDGTLTATVDNGQAEFEAQWEEAIAEKLGNSVDLNIQQLDHSGYSDAVQRLFASGDYPDVMIMSASMYAEYASTGILWDMTEAYENAEFQERITAPEINESLKKNGSLYGFAPAYGNGCVTYVKQSWLDAVGMSVDDIKTYDDYYNMLVAFTTQDPDGNGVNDTYGTIAAGFGKMDEAPYINYLPEFWQDAYPAIYEKDGVWVDGFQEEATKEALNRLRTAYVDGVIDPETLTAGTKQAREKFFSNDQSGSSGAFAYWAGTWYQTLTDNLVKNEVDTDLVMLEPIEEVGAYINREAPVWVIIDDGDGDDSREQAIFDTFIETMLDGGKIQVLWTYGAEDVHWSTKAESFTTNPDDPDKKKDYSYEEGEFHLKQSPNDSNTLWKKNAMDPALVIAPLVGDYADFSSTSSLAAQGNTFFTANCKNAYQAPSCETYTAESGTITDAKNACITDVVVNGVDVDTAMATYVATVGSTIDQCLTELNSAE